MIGVVFVLLRLFTALLFGVGLFCEGVMYSEIIAFIGQGTLEGIASVRRGVEP